MTDKRESGRLKDANQRRVLDAATRKRRQKKALEALEEDNFHDDPHANLVMNKKAPKFEESLDRGRRRKSKGDLFKQRFRKSFAALLEEESMLTKEAPNYFSAAAPSSPYPERKFCAVCGFPSNYTCGPCGARYCSVKCLCTHQDTRCLKWTA